MNSTLQNSIRQAARLIDGADALIICAGAGMGVDSGLPDFRGTEGFWQAYPALGRARMRFEQIASPQNFLTKPELAWGFYGHRLQLYRQTVPHAGFALLKAWADARAGGGWVFTSNVDGQFQQAGFNADAVEECHGSIHDLQCLQPCSEMIWPALVIDPDIDEDACLWRGPLPACPRCWGVARPNILMFDDWHWIDTRRQAQRGNRLVWLERLRERSLRPVVIEIGAGTAIPSVRQFATQTRRALDSLGARLIRINPVAAAVSGPLDVGLPMGALAALQAIAPELA